MANDEVRFVLEYHLCRGGYGQYSPKERMVLTKREEKFGDVVGVEGAGLGGEAAGQVGVPDVRDVIVLVELPGPDGLYVAPGLRRQVHHDRPRLHGFNHLLQERHNAVCVTVERNNEIQKIVARHFLRNRRMRRHWRETVRLPW